MARESAIEIIRSAQSAEEQERFADAADLYEKAIELRRDGPTWWHVRRAQALILAGDRPNAISEYETAIAKNPDANLQTALRELRRWDKTKNKSLQASATYYDDVYRHSQTYLRAGEETNYSEMWERIAKLLANNRSKAVLDIGCGP